MVRAGLSSNAGVARPLKWLLPELVTVMSWQSVQARPMELTWRLCCPEKKLLNCGVWLAVPAVWQSVHWLLTLMLPVAHGGVVTPPWQLTLMQVRVAVTEPGPLLAAKTGAMAVEALIKPR